MQFFLGLFWSSNQHMLLILELEIYMVICKCIKRKKEKKKKKCCLLAIRMQTIFCVNDGLGAIVYMMFFKHVSKSCLTIPLDITIRK
jgi:hypothetical protein